MKLKFQIAFLSLLLTLTGCMVVVTDTMTRPSTVEKRASSADHVRQNVKKPNESSNKNQKPSTSLPHNEKPSSQNNRVRDEVKSGTDNVGRAPEKSTISNPKRNPSYNKPAEQAENKDPSRKKTDSSSNRK